MKTKKIYSILFVPVMMLALILGCTDDDAITYSMDDVTETRITGVSSDVTGAGASWTINGSQMDKVTRVFFENFVIPAKTFTDVSESSITLTVPTSAPLGENDVLIVFAGSERANLKVTLVPLPAITGFSPAAVSTGESVSVFGTNFTSTSVTGLNIGGVSATIISQSDNVIKFTVPAGMTSNKITLTGPIGTSSSATDLVACPGEAIDCATGLNLNAGFELGTGDNFDNWSKYNGGTFMLATAVPSEVYRGARALKVVRDGSLSSGQWRIQLASDLVATDVGASYTVYVWAKASAAGGSIRVSTSPNSLYTGDQAITTSWQRLAFTFAAANETSTRVVLDMNGNESAVTTFFIDDVKLIKN
jgi:hypothetical protein